MAQAKFEIDVTPGPTLRAALRVAKAAIEIGELVPEWHSRERDALKKRLKRLSREIRRDLKSQQQ